MATETKKRSADEVATLFVEQAVRVTREYQERMQEAGSDHYLTAVYNTVVCGGVNTELSPRQARWLTSLLKAERRETPQGSVLADGQPVGTWLYRSWSDRRSNKTRHRIIYTLAADFAATTFGIDHETMQAATLHDQRIAVKDLMIQGIEQYTQLVGEPAIPDMESCVVNLEHGRITLYGRNLFEGPLVVYSGEWYGDWMCAVSSSAALTVVYGAGRGMIFGDSARGRSIAWTALNAAPPSVESIAASIAARSMGEAADHWSDPRPVFYICVR